MMAAQEQALKVDIREVGSYKDGTGWKRRFLHLTIVGIDPDDPWVPLNLGELGIARMVDLKPQPLGEHFSVVWDGDVERPHLAFDSYPNGAVRIAIEVTGR